MDLKYLDEMAAFWGKKRVLITGNTGFKGSWLSILLHHCGAEVYGFALKPNTNPSLFELANLSQKVSQTYGDINNINEVKETIMRSKPEVIFHLAAQPLVRNHIKDQSRHLLQILWALLIFMKSQGSFHTQNAS